ncbi:MAG: hypothetical protein KY459_04055 [Acidobacteria bacterium]|nr:hypothetical protein [Acidobacteriota bacterium]
MSKKATKTTGKASSSRSAMAGRFVVQKKSSGVFINGNKVLVPAGKSSVSRKKIGQAVEKVVSRRKSA